MLPYFLAALSLFASACGAPPLMKLPTNPMTPAADAREVLAQAAQACQGLNAWTAEVGVNGSVDGQHVRGRMIVGVERPASARIEAAAPFGAPLFIFVARGGEATLLLPRDDRVLEHGRPEAVLDAATGVPLDPASLLSALTACPQAPDIAGARAIGADWRIVQDGDGELYVRRESASAAWQIVAAVRPAWRAEYRDFDNGMPRSVRLTGADAHHFDLRLALSQVAINPALGTEAFAVSVPRTAFPITLDELRHSRPGVREN